MLLYLQSLIIGRCEPEKNMKCEWQAKAIILYKKNWKVSWHAWMNSRAVFIQCIYVNKIIFICYHISIANQNKEKC